MTARRIARRTHEVVGRPVRPAENLGGPHSPVQQSRTYPRQVKLRRPASVLPAPYVKNVRSCRTTRCNAQTFMSDSNRPVRAPRYMVPWHRARITWMNRSPPKRVPVGEDGRTGEGQACVKVWNSC